MKIFGLVDDDGVLAWADDLAPVSALMNLVCLKKITLHFMATISSSRT